MQVDLEQIRERTAYTADVCIAGAGIAGLVLADALRGSGLRVALLEGGGGSLEARSQQLYSVEMAGHPHAGASEGRFRTFGGSSTRWGGQLLSYTNDVFHPPQSTGMTGWPIDEQHLETYYATVLRTMGVPEEVFVPESVPFAEGDSVRMRFSRWAPFPRRSLTGTLGRRCQESADVTVYLHANATKLVREASGNIGSLEAVNYAGRRCTFLARRFVVCLGTIESSRLLLYSDIGNEADQVGRYFYDHLGIHAATLDGAARAAAAKIFLPRLKDGSLYSPKLEATGAWRERHGAQAVMAHFPLVEADDSPATTVRLLLQSVQRKEVTPGLLRRLASLPVGSVELLKMAYATKVLERRRLSKHTELRLNLDVEQKPLAESRVTLGEGKDALGLPQVRLDWRIGEAELSTLRLFAPSILTVLRAAGVDGIQVKTALLDESQDLKALVADTYHMMGGTRMGATACDSVVDRDLKVHGIANCYVAGCSVFPTGGSSNPTFTMMALTLRLAEMLKAGGR